MTTHLTPGSKVAIVVVNYGAPDLLEANLARMSTGDAVVHVVDNFSTQQHRLEVKKLCQRYRWIGHYPDGNLGFGTGCNLAAEAAIEHGSRLILLLNPDATIDTSSRELLQEVVAAEPLCLAAPVVYTPDDQVWSAGVDLHVASGSMQSWAKRTDPPEGDVIPWLTGTCLMLSAELWSRVGGFDPDYFLYWEDTDLSAKVQAAGGTLRLVEEARAYHEEGSTHGDADDRAKSSIYYYYNVRNRMIFARKHLSAQQRRRWARTAVPEAYRILLRGGRRQFRRPMRTIWPALRGLVDGWRLVTGRH